VARAVARGPAPAPGRLLEVRDLRKRFGGVRAVDEVTFAVHEGEILALLGPNGSGKTTLFDLIAGAVRPDAGEVYFRGERITAQPASRRAGLGIARTFQLVRTFPRLTVRENVLVARFYSREPPGSRQAADAEAAALLDLVGLGQKADRSPADLTLSERKTLEIARALATRPRLLLLDEPTAGLSRASLDALLALFSGIRARGVTLVIVEHNVRAIRALCDRIIVLNAGRKIADGDPDAVLDRPDVVQAYLGAP
jgi:ABC-type branched-subunit amino acid transport system ATPase component